MAMFDIRRRPHARCLHLLLVDGLPYAWTDDTSGLLTGSGLHGYLGAHELAKPWENLGDRVVLPGLVVPKQISNAVNEKNGLLEGGGLVSFELLDLDETLVRLFASEGKHEDAKILIQRIPPGKAALGDVFVEGNVNEQVSTHGKNIGIERIGPNGERRYFHALPKEGIGFEHIGRPDLMAPVVISDEPIDFAGRLVTLYRIYHDGEAQNQAGLAPWPTWEEQHDARNLIWWGTIRDLGEIDGRTWSINCFSQDSLMKKRLGTQLRSPETWMRVEGGAIDLADEERYVSVNFSIRSNFFITHPDHNQMVKQVQSVVFDGTIFDRKLTGTTIEEMRESLDEIIQEAADGTNTNYVPAGITMPPLDNAIQPAAYGGVLDEWDYNGKLSVGFNAERRFRLRKQDDGPSGATGDSAWLEMVVTLHRRAWAIFGFDREGQGTGFPSWMEAAYETFHEIDFEPNELLSGQEITFNNQHTGFLVPADAQGYYRARFTTMGVADGKRNNNKNVREYWPYHKVSAIIDTSVTPQKLFIEPHGVDLFWPPANHIPPNPNLNAGATAARHFVLRGQFQTDPDEDPVERYQVVRASYQGGAGFLYGSVENDELTIERFLVPRNWGFDDERLGPGVVWIASEDSPIEIAPLIDWAHQTRIFALLEHDRVERVADVFLYLLYGSGTGSFEFQAVPSAGENDPPNAFLDLYGDDQALAIPQALIDHEGILETFEGIGQGLGVVHEDADPLLRGRYAYLDPPNAYELIDSIMRPRGLSLSLHGARYSLFRMGLFSPEDADVIITEADLYGTPGSPITVIPKQELRITGQIDMVQLDYRHDLDGGGLRHTLKEPARDAGAKFRTGMLVHEIYDEGLLSPALEYGHGSQSRAEIAGVGHWEGTFEELWTHGEDSLATFFSTRHFAIEVTVSRPKGQDLRPGTAVLFSNPWPADNDGTYGLHAKVGRVISVIQHLDTGAATARIMIFGGQALGVALYGPICRVKGIDGNLVSYYDDFREIGDPNLNDGRGFQMPPWWEIGSGQLEVAVYIRKGTRWTLGPTNTVVSVDEEARTITCADPWPSLPWRDKDRILVGRPLSEQAENSWPTDLYAPIVAPNAKDEGKPFVP